MKIPTYLAVASNIVSLVGCDASAPTSANGPVDGDLGVLQFELVADHVAEGPNDLRLLVRGLDGREPEVSIRTLMPAMGHATDEATIARTADGEFLLRGVLFDMPGAWALRVRVDEPGSTEALDEAEFQLDVP